MAKNRMPTGLVALSTTAIAAIYIAGYVRTQAADATIANAQAAPTASVASLAAPQTAPATPVPTNAPAVGVRRNAQPAVTSRAAPTATPAAAPAAQSQAAGYKDGTFSGHGSSRRGDVWVDVIVQGGQITNVNITRSTLQYPLREISALPGEVVQRQSAQVDTVSRATYSSMAFKGAVSQALSQAVHG